MALQNRYGDYSNFDPDKMVTGEIAVVVSGDPNSENGRSVYVCFAPGIVKRFTTYSDFESEIQNATEDVQNQFTEEIRLTIESAVEETARATNAAEAAQTAAENAIEAAAAANAAAGGDISNKTVTFSTSSNRELLTSGENTSGLFGKIAKWFSDLKNAAFCDVANNLVTTEEGYLLDARQGKILDDKISEQNTNLKKAYKGVQRAGTKDSDIVLGEGTAFLIMMIHNGEVNNNGMYMYYPVTSRMYTLVNAPNVTWTCNGSVIRFSCSGGTPHISYIVIA